MSRKRVIPKPLKKHASNKYKLKPTLGLFDLNSDLLGSYTCQEKLGLERIIYCCSNTFEMNWLGKLVTANDDLEVSIYLNYFCLYFEFL